MKQLNNEAIDGKHFESLYPPESREKEIAQILTCIKSGNFNQAISLPGGGRSQVLRLLAYNRSLREKHLGKKEKDFHFVLCNFSEVRNKSLNDVLKFLYSSLNDFFASRHSGLSRISLNDRDSGVALFNALKKAIEHLTLEKNMNIVFLFDNFDEYLPMVGQDFFKDLKILRNLAIYKFSTVFALNRPLETVLDQEVIADIYQFIADHKVYINLCDLPSLEFRISFIEKALGKTIKKDSLEKIISLTGGHVNLTRLCVETILESNIDLSSFWGAALDAATPESDLYRAGIRDSGRASLARMTDPESDSKGAAFLLRHKSIQGTLLDIWNSLTPAEQNLLKGSPTSEVVLRLRHTSEVKHVENIGLLKNGKITIKLLEYFLKQNPFLQTAEEYIVFDKDTKEIKKGSLLISDKLTSFEYNFLRFLLENPNRVVERNEIIKAVWKEEKSTLGVTDQALDQLVFRVRHKIENDPNKPVHLQTVKGRGFRFVP